MTNRTPCSYRINAKCGADAGWFCNCFRGVPMCWFVNGSQRGSKLWKTIIMTRRSCSVSAKQNALFLFGSCLSNRSKRSTLSCVDWKCGADAGWFCECFSAFDMIDLLMEAKPTWKKPVEAKFPFSDESDNIDCCWIKEKCTLVSRLEVRCRCRYY